MSTACFYLIIAYTPPFVRVVLHLAAKENTMITLCVVASNFFWLPIMLAVSDGVGRERPLSSSHVSLAGKGERTSMTHIVLVPN